MGVWLQQGHLRGFRIHGYGDGDETCSIVRGSGSLSTGTIVTNAKQGIRLMGSIDNLDYRTAVALQLQVNGSVIRSSFRSESIGGIAVTGPMEVEDGHGGVL